MRGCGCGKKLKLWLGIFRQNKFAMMFLKGLFDIFGYWIVCLKLAIVAAVPGQNALLKVAAAVSVSADLRGCVENRGGQVDGAKKV